MGISLMIARKVPWSHHGDVSVSCGRIYSGMKLRYAYSLHSSRGTVRFLIQEGGGAQLGLELCDGDMEVRETVHG